MIDELRITVLAENTVRRSGLLAEHGLALWIESGARRILFDTGQGMVLSHNAERLKISLETAEDIVISHGHYDHTGGLQDVLERNKRATLWMHPSALNKKHHREKTPPHRSIGVPGSGEQALRQQTSRMTWTRAPAEIAEGIGVTGEIPRRNDFEDTGGSFYLDESCTVPDPMLDDQAMYIDTPGGLVVIVGCAHAGVVNTLDYIAQLTGRDQFYAVMGGMHLARATQRRLEATLAAMKRYRVQKIGAAHCTGMRATAYLWSQLPGACFECSVGLRLAIGGRKDAVD